MMPTKTTRTTKKAEFSSTRKASNGLASCATPAGGPEHFEIFDYNKKVCDEIAEICAGKGYSVSYSQYVSDSY